VIGPLASLLLAALAPVQATPGDTLTLAAFLAEVRAFHPVARQAALLEARAAAEAQVAVGRLFDPVLSASWDRKQFGGSEYYNYLEADLRVPTPLGVDVTLGLDRTRGTRTGADRYTPEAGTVSLGLSLPLGQGIVSDRRRAAAAEARVLREAAVGEGAAARNRLLYDATVAWAEWRAASEVATLAAEGVRLAEVRLAATRQRVLAGDAAPIDTIEASLEVARRQAAAAFATADIIATREALEAMRWDAAGAPVALDASVQPGRLPTDPPPNEVRLAAWLEEARRAHPEVRRTAGRAEAARAARRQAVVELLPDVTAKVARLADRDALDGLSGFPESGGNYSFGLKASTSLLLWSERGQARAAAARLESADLGVADALRRMSAAARTAAAMLDAATAARENQAVAVDYARRLLEAEVRLFDAGQSTLFLLNLRERTLLDESARLANTEAKAITARAALAVALGFPAVLPES
jgi:outer membrane protein TolC